MTTENTPTISPIRQIESLYARLEKARTIAAAGKVHPIIGMTDHYTVESSKGNGFYLVNGVCTCPDATNRTDLVKGYCKHRLAALVYAEQMDSSKDLAPNESPQKDEGLEEKVNDLYQ